MEVNSQQAADPARSHGYDSSGITRAHDRNRRVAGAPFPPFSRLLTCLARVVQENPWPGDPDRRAPDDHRLGHARDAELEPRGVPGSARLAWTAEPSSPGHRTTAA